MRIHIIGVATTFMTGLAVLARKAGHDVTASDSCIDLPSRKILIANGVSLNEGFRTENLAYKPDLVIVGNEISINNEELLEARHQSLPSVSGVFWLEQHVLNDKWQINEEAEDNLSESKKMFVDKKTVKTAPKLPPDPNSKFKQRIVR